MAGTLFITLGTTILIGTMFVVPLASLDTVQSDNVTISQVQDTITGAYSDTVICLLDEAGNKIADEDIADYYQQLCDEYNLDEHMSEMVHQEQNVAVDMIPVENINHTALSSMLEEAGSTIHDNEIAEFYYQFLDKAGWGIEPKD